MKYRSPLSAPIAWEVSIKLIIFEPRGQSLLLVGYRCVPPVADIRQTKDDVSPVGTPVRIADFLLWVRWHFPLGRPWHFQLPLPRSNVFKLYHFLIFTLHEVKIIILLVSRSLSKLVKFQRMIFLNFFGCSTSRTARSCKKEIRKILIAVSWETVEIHDEIRDAEEVEELKGS